MFILWPKRVLELRSSFTQENCLERIQAEMYPWTRWPAPFTWNKLWHTIHTNYKNRNKNPGTITGNKFELLMQHRRAKALVNGTIIPLDTGSIIRVVIRSPNIWIMYVYFCFLILCLLVKTKSLIFEEDAGYRDIYGALGMIVFGIILVRSSYNFSLKEVKAWFHRVLETHECNSSITAR